LSDKIKEGKHLAKQTIMSKELLRCLDKQLDCALINGISVKKDLLSLFEKERKLLDFHKKRHATAIILGIIVIIVIIIAVFLSRMITGLK
jgi:predicted nucleic acid-binding Zn ribbon protein